MSDTIGIYDNVAVEGESTTITRQCSELSGCGEEVEVTVNEDGTTEGARFIGEVERVADGADLVTERLEDDEWVGLLPRVEWSETEIVEVWLHEECIDVDHDTDRSVASS